MKTLLAILLLTLVSSTVISQVVNVEPDILLNISYTEKNPVDSVFYVKTICILANSKTDYSVAIDKKDMAVAYKLIEKFISEIGESKIFSFQQFGKGGSTGPGHNCVGIKLQDKRFNSSLMPENKGEFLKVLEMFIEFRKECEKALR